MAGLTFNGIGLVCLFGPGAGLCGNVVPGFECHGPDLGQKRFGLAVQPLRPFAITAA